MEENREVIEDLERRYGFNEKEAKASYHLREAMKLFEELHAEYDKPGSRTGAQIAGMLGFGIHFAALNKELGMRVLRRDYSEGWGRGTRNNPSEPLG